MLRLLTLGQDGFESFLNSPHPLLRSSLTLVSSDALTPFMQSVGLSSRQSVGLHVVSLGLLGFGLTVTSTCGGEDKSVVGIVRRVRAG